MVAMNKTMSDFPVVGSVCKAMAYKREVDVARTFLAKVLKSWPLINSLLYDQIVVVSKVSHLDASFVSNRRAPPWVFGIRICHNNVMLPSCCCDRRMEFPEIGFDGVCMLIVLGYQDENCTSSAYFSNTCV